MSTWDRTNRLEMDLALLRSTVARLEDDLITLGLEHAHALGCLNEVTAQRDRARDIAVRLEQDLAAATSGVVLVPVWGEAR